MTFHTNKTKTKTRIDWYRRHHHHHYFPSDTFDDDYEFVKMHDVNNSLVYFAAPWLLQTQMKLMV